MKDAIRKVVATEAGDLTKEKILLAAQGLFAAQGFHGVSMRDVGTAAGVPFALTTYHFQTKLNLYRAIFQKHRDLLYTGRITALQNISLSGNTLKDITQITHAVVEPLMALRQSAQGPDVMRLIGRELHDPVEIHRGIVEEFFDPIAELAIAMLQRVVPSAMHRQVCWAFYFATGAISINHVDVGRLERISHGDCKTADTNELVTELTRFIAAGLTGSLVDSTG